jgi:hypothetical protein
MLFSFYRPRFLTCANINNGNVTFKRPGNGTGQINLRRWRDTTFRLPAKENGQNNPGAARRQPADRIAVAKYDATDTGRVRIGSPAIRWDHRLDDLD